VIGSLGNPERDRCGWRARDIANWVVPSNAETGKAIEIADRGGMPRAGGGRLAERRMCEAGAIVLN
jgi:hypothetical protein